MNYKITKIISIFFLFLFVFFSTSINSKVFADSPDEIKRKIEERTKQIEEIEKEISKYREEVRIISLEARTLENAISSIDASLNKILTEIRSTESRIELTDLNIQKLQNDIQQSEENIKGNKETISSLIRMMNEADNTPLILTFLSNGNISEIWSDLESLRSLQSSMREKLNELQILKIELEKQKDETEIRKKEFIEYNQELLAQRQIVEQSRLERSKLLEETRGTESEYRNLLAEQQRRKEEFERELFEFESQLERNVDPTSVPSPRPGLLSWPLDNIFVTQFFGRTVDAQRLYVSGTHNGVDFRAPVGTRVRSVADGVVEGFGNTDSYPGCYSYGRWILIRHNNGLSSLYAHLSVINVNQGQIIKRGDVIGFSGNTGYSTGPHLHLTVYASQGVKIERYLSSIGCRAASIPLADRKSYIDPMLYLPPYNR